ncbi:O-antigen translocase [Erwinia sp. OLTSP20]|uniref:lipid III flippase WzxE n=1 Tax=unclassified Erwinia TaxID=2622719 RepID=UPI000C19B0CD|nr:MULTISPECIES: lipid III flippase WzxE [unclassified Erwinia]PIJ50772.1 O-antigen translocase [Erwinia sp. OAMSP11]PIJ72924.1 O-antigen translocase [Erwinia sp. OLSSP12]PIJ81939.1 O-antigen translocase [Erwinia sp. OLCASP19]PIJ84594.1 O-antigen translocase [Erwinia sp. OLMTSP26]PIJ86941.1 O-antigen translocase [Erwinia sp. OLMDSP33]
MSLARASLWTASSTLVKILAGLVVIKLMAVSYGPQGVGLAGNFRQLITVLGVLAGAGIFNGVTTLIAERQQQPEALRAVLGSASLMVLVFSLLLAAFFLLLAVPVSQVLFGRHDFAGVIRIVALLQLGIAWANLMLAIIKGYRDATANALALIGGSVAGVLAWICCHWLGGYRGALVGLAMVPVLVLLPASWLMTRRARFPWHYLRPCWQPAVVMTLSKYTLMALITTATLPVAWVMMRNQLAVQAGWDQVGIWLGVTSLSDAWLQFITASFSVWLLPTLARLHDKTAISQEIGRTLLFVLPVVSVVACCVWLLRDIAIWLLFSPQFSPMRDLFIWQLPGDVLKVGAYVFGYLVIAKAALRIYILTEISQFVLLLGFAHWLIPLQGTRGAAQAYLATYVVYFVLCVCAFLIYRFRK